MQGRRVYKRPYFNPDNARKRVYSEAEIRHDAHKYLRAHMFIERLRKYSKELTMQEYKDLREIALNGDLDLAHKKLEIILREKATFQNVGGSV